jgi:hypothetical protein
LEEDRGDEEARLGCPTTQIEERGTCVEETLYGDAGIGKASSSPAADSYDEAAESKRVEKDKGRHYASQIGGSKTREVHFRVAQEPISKVEPSLVAGEIDEELDLKVARENSEGQGG